MRRAAGGMKPDIVTDQTSAHDLVNGYLPMGWTLRSGRTPHRQRQHAALRDAAAASCAVHVQAMLDFQAMGIPTVDYGNNIRQVAYDRGVKNAFDFPASCRPTSGRCSAAAGAVPLGRAVGRPGGHREDRREDEGAVPEDKHLHRWLDMAASASPSRACRRASAGSASASGTGPAWRSTRWSSAAN